MNDLRNTAPRVVSAIAIAAVLAGGAFAQEATPSEVAEADDEVTLDRVTVTGSFIKRSQKSLASPTTTVDQDSIRQQGVATPSDLVNNLTFVSGSEFNFDQSDQDRTPGTSQINIRGLGLSSTLVLINGRRQTLSPSPAQGGDTFVDVNQLAPVIALSEVEVLKDGASALYGTEAVAGVANFKTRSDFEGFEFQVENRFSGESDDFSDTILQAIAGVQGDRGGAVLSVSYLDRDELSTCDRDFSCEPARTESSFGNPGTFIVTAPITTGNFAGTPAFSTIVDPNCPPEENSGTRCTYNFGPNNALIPATERLNAFAEVNYQINDWAEAFGEFGFARSKTDAPNSPSLPLLGFGSIIVPTDHPDNIFGVPAIWLGRPFADAGLERGQNRNINQFDDTTYRFVGGLRGSISNTETWTWDTAFGYSAAQRQYTLRGTLAGGFIDALNGFGGINCIGDTPGANGCEYFNPFGTALTTSPNSPELIDFITTDNPTEEETSLKTIDAVVTGELFDVPAGAVSAAFGFQYRDETRSIDSSPDAEREDIFFFFGGVDQDVSRDVTAYFAELAIPVFDNEMGALELQAAMRFEDYGNGLDTTDPKIAALYRPNDWLSLRGSWGTSLRAASLLQIGQEQVAFDAFVDAISGGFSFVPSVALPNANLEPETAETWNLGFTANPTDTLSISVDYYNIEYEDLLTSENTGVLIAQELEAYRATCADPATLTGCDVSALNSAQVLRDPVTLAPQRVLRNRFNAASAKTSGFDLSATYEFPATSFGDFTANLNSSYVLEYDLQTAPGAPVIDAAGSRNKLLQPLVRSMPELRLNVGLDWSNGAHSASATVRHIDEYYDDQNDADVDSMKTVDLQYSYDFSEFFGSQESLVTIGAINAFDEEPPLINSETGYDSKVHSPVGQVFYVRLTQAF